MRVRYTGGGRGGGLRYFKRKMKTTFERYGKKKGILEGQKNGESVEKEKEERRRVNVYAEKGTEDKRKKIHTMPHMCAHVRTLGKRRKKRKKKKR